jgi:hypothetical protein
MTEDELIKQFRLSQQPALCALFGVMTLADELYRRGVIDQSAVTNMAAVMNARLRTAEEIAGEPLDWTTLLRAKLDGWSA